MATKHRVFNADRFLDRFQGHEDLLRKYVAGFGPKLKVDADGLTIDSLKEFLVRGEGEARDEFTEGLYRAFDLCTERGHEDLIAASNDWHYDPDPDGELPVECLSLKVLAEDEEVFNLAYDRYTFWRAERFTVYRGKSPQPISDAERSKSLLQQKLGELFKADKDSDRVLVRAYSEDSYTNFVVYHEKRTKAELVFKGSRARLRVSPTVFRPAQQDFISYDQKTAQVEIEAGFESEERTLRKAFAECCLGDQDFFEGEDAAERTKLSRVAEADFAMPVDEGHSAVIVELQFALKQKHAPTFVVRSKDTLETLDLNNLRGALAGSTIKRVIFKMTFPDDHRGKRVELSGANTVKFKRATHASDVFRFLRRWRILLD
jgi:hypothetical protein